jgi:hypothetical protein
MHELFHNRQFSKADRTIISTRQIRNDDHDKQIRTRRRQKNLWDRKKWKHHRSESEDETVASFIDHFHRSSSRLFYNTFDHCWVSLSRARIEHEIKNFKSEKKFKKFDLREHDRFEIIWQKDLIILRSFDKKTWSFWSLHRSFDDTNATKQIQIRDETIKTNVKRLRMTITE